MTQISILEDDSLLLERREQIRNINFIGINFTPLNANQLFERVVQKAQSDDKFGYLVTPNIDHFVRFEKNPENASIYEQAWLNVSDSRIIELLASFSGFKIPACPGSDLTKRLVEEAIGENDEISLIGGDAQLLEVIQNKYNFKKIHWYEPPMGLKTKPDERMKCAQFIANLPSNVRYHFICLGSPQQEMVCQDILKFENVKGIGLCVGASFDFLAGKAKRAPIFMQNLRLEWLFRLLSEPKRLWKRYLVEGPRIAIIWLKWLKNQKSKA